MKNKALYYSFWLLFSIIAYSCGKDFKGEKDLGNKFKLKELSKNKSVLVYCISEGSLGCNSSYDVVPDKIKDLDYNKEWIIAKTYKTSKNYWLIKKDFIIDLENCDNVSCDSILKSNIQGPLDSLKFYNILELKNIPLNFKH